MIKEAYCSDDICKLLKEKGFREYCTALNRLVIKDGEKPFMKVTHQKAMAWLREEHDIETCVEYSIPDDAYNYTIIVKDVTNGFTIIHSEGTYEFYEKATDELLKYCLENLI